VTPTVCITLAFWLGRMGLICNGGCCALTYGAAQIEMSPIAKVKRESRFREIMLALLVKEFGALCNAHHPVGKGLGVISDKNSQLLTNRRTHNL